MPITIASIMNLMGPDMMVILLIVLLLFGAKKLPELARGMGRAVKEFSAARDEIEKGLSQSGPSGVAPSEITGHKERATVCAVVLAASTGFSTASHRQLRYRKSSMIARVTRRPRKKRIVILGGGFGGVYAAVYLGKLFSSRELKEIEIVLVNRENYIVFQPLLPEIISGSVELNHVIAPIRRMAPKAQLYTREVESIDPIARRVTLSPGIRPTSISLQYDHLVIAIGTRLDYSKIPGMREHATPFKYLSDALYLRNQLVRVLEEAETEPDPEIRSRLLTFVVAGGGFSGVECIAEMNDFLRDAVRAYHNISEGDLRLILLQRGNRILPEVTESLATFAQELLVKRGIEVRLGVGLRAVSARAVIVEDKATGKAETIPTRTTVATVPAGPHPLLTSLPFPQDKGRLSSTKTPRSLIG